MLCAARRPAFRYPCGFEYVRQVALRNPTFLFDRWSCLAVHELTVSAWNPSVREHMYSSDRRQRDNETQVKLEIESNFASASLSVCGHGTDLWAPVPSYLPRSPPTCRAEQAAYTAASSSLPQSPSYPLKVLHRRPMHPRQKPHLLRPPHPLRSPLPQSQPPPPRPARQ